MTSTAPHAAPPAPDPAAAAESVQEMAAVARALFTLLLPGSAGTTAPHPPEPLRQEMPAEPATPPPPAEQVAAPALAPVALPVPMPAEPPGVQPPSSQPAALPLPGAVTIEVPPLDAEVPPRPSASPQTRGSGTMAMLTEIGFLDD